MFLPALLGSTVRATSVGEMVAGSDLVFEGRVAHLRAEGDPENRLVYTVVTFEVIDLVKGNWASSTIELRFLGGTADGRTLEVSEMVLPTVGEQGVYFVESLSRPQVHPLFGWSQGHLRVLEDSAGHRRVYSYDLRPIVAVQEEAPVPRDVSSGIAAGLETDRAGAPATAVRLENFKASLRRLGAKSKP